MPAKKATKKTAKKARAKSTAKSKNKNTKPVRVLKDGRSHGSLLERPYDEACLPLLSLDSESKEEREKRLAAKKALTLKAFQMAYENHHRRRKAS